MMFKNPFKRQDKTAQLAAKNKPDEKEKRFLPYERKAVFVTRQDVRSWKRALSLAQSDEPRNFSLQLLYEEILNDALLTSQINNRKQQVLSTGFSLKNAKGEIDEEQTKLLKKHPIYRLLTNAGLDSIYHGYTLVELDFIDDINKQKVLTGEVLPRTNVVPQTGLFYTDYHNDKGIKYREIPEYGIWILEYNSGNLGLLNKAVSHVLFKRFSQSCWSELCEIYGIPPRVMKTNTQDTVMLNRAEQMMSDMGSAAWFIIDETEEFEFAQGVATKGEVYESLIKLCSNEMSMLISGAIIGQDTKNGNRSKDESSQEVLWYLVQSDMVMCEEHWNNITIPALVKLGILKGELTFEYDETEDLEQLWKITSEALPHFTVDPVWIKTKFGIEVTGEKNTPPDKEGDKKKKAEEKESEEKESEDLGFFAEAPQAGANLHTLPSPGGEGSGVRLKECCNSSITLELPNDGFDVNKIIQAVTKAEGKGFLYPELFYFNAVTLLQGFESGWNKKAEAKLDIGFTYDYDDPKIKTAWELNLFQFSTVKAAAQSAEVNDIFRKAKSFNEFQTILKKLYGVDKKHQLRTEYDTANAVGQSAATYYRLLKQTATFKYWKYLTVGDDHVRHEHALLHGIVLKWDDQIWDKIFPPNGWNCRCYIVPVLESEVTPEMLKLSKDKAAAFLASDEFKRAKKNGFGINRANTQEVFTASQSYSKTPDKVLNNVGKMYAEDWGMKPILERQKKATEVFEPAADRAVIDDFYQKYKVSKRKMLLADYASRDIEMQLNRLIKHTSDNAKYGNRYKYLSVLEEILKHPDEVWINNDASAAFNSYVYIKYYKNEIIKVICQLNASGDLEIQTWYNIEFKNTDSANKQENDLFKNRRGLPVKK